jgi:TRAP transporter TAXI family solute receptor
LKTSRLNENAARQLQPTGRQGGNNHCSGRSNPNAISVLRWAAAIATSVLAWTGPTWTEEANWPRSIAIGTGSPGGIYYGYGEGIGRIVTRALHVETTAHVTQGPAQNIVLMEKKEAMLGFVTMGVALQGWNGTDWAKGTRYRAMRVIFPMYDTAFQFAAPKRLAIKSLTDFAGLRVGVGPRAGTAGTYVPKMFKLFGIAAEIHFGAIEQMTSQLATGKLDAIAFALGFPIQALAELDAMQPIAFIGLTPEQSADIRKQIPELTGSTIPAGTYRSLVQDYQTIGLYNFAIAHKDLSDDLVYNIVKGVFDNRDELVKSQSLAKETIPANVSRNTILPLHPGAIRYYREAGVPIPPGATAGN